MPASNFGLTVGNFTHLLLATLFATQHLPPLSTDHRVVRASQRGPLDMLPPSPPVRRSLSQPKSLHLPLHVDDHRFCKGGARLDVFGHHRSACSQVGPVETTRDPAEICVARICREAGARVKENQLLCDLNIVVPVTSAESRSSRTVFLSGVASGLGTVWSGCCGVFREGPLGRPSHPRGSERQAPQMPRVG